jgi:prepilin-type N-terminal cleavage/methylation domain-containing protein
MKSDNCKGFSLLEVLVAILIVAASIGGLAALYPGIYTGVNEDMLNLRAWESCQRYLETYKNSNFANLLNVATLPGQTPSTQTILGDGKTSAVYYAEKMKDKTNNVLDDIVSLRVVVCYKFGNRVLGEDSNLNGALNSGEDVDGHAGLDSPITLRTLVYKH